MRNASRASFTAASGNCLSFPSTSNVAVSAPPSPLTSTNRPSNRPPCSGANTDTHRPTNRRHSPDERSGRSPGDETCSTYCSGTSPLVSSRASSVRDTRVQSATLTLCPSRRSMRISTSGRLFVPPRRSSTKSNPAASSSAITTASSVSFTLCRGVLQEQKNVGSIPHILLARRARAAITRYRTLGGASTLKQLAACHDTTCQRGAANITPTWRPESPARCEKKRSW